MNWTNFICSVILFGLGISVMIYMCPEMHDLSIMEFLIFSIGMLIWKHGFDLEWWNNDKVR